jgi:hypothetical protein
MQVRPLSEADQPALERLEQDLRPDDEKPRTNAAALRFFARSGHSFVAEDEHGVQGFVLAQPLWQGDRATVLVTRLIARAHALGPLLKALEKSAYDAAAYELALPADEGTPLAGAALNAGYYPGPRLFAKRLGSASGRRGVLE